MFRNEKLRIGLLIGVALLSFFAGIGRAPLFNKDEGAFCEATREMMLSGNYIMTYLNGEPRYDKPILIYWLQALSVKCFGLTEFAFRLPSALAACLWALAVYLFARRRFGADTAFWAAFFLMTSVQVSVIGKAAIADALLNLLIAVAMFSLWQYYEREDSTHLYAAAIAMALGVLSKGPVAILIPCAATFLFCLIRGEWRRWFRTLAVPGPLLLFMAIAVPWYAAVLWVQGWAFVEGFLLRHNVQRFSGPFEGHGGSLFYYIPVILIGLMPYTAALLRSLSRFREDFRDPFRQYLLIWFLFVWVFFSLSGTKLPHYVIYGYTPLFLLMALHLDSVRSDRWLMTPAVALFAALLFLPLVVPMAIPRVKDPYAVDALRAAAGYLRHWTYLLPMSAGLAALLALAIARRPSRGMKLIAAGIITTAMVNFIGLFLTGAVLHQPVKEAAQVAREQNLEVVAWQVSLPSFMVYQERLMPKTPSSGELVVLTESHWLPHLGEYEVLYEKHGIALARITRLAGS